MTIVFVHGVPETPALWDDLRSRLSGPSVALRLPGFGSPLPEGLTGKDAYADWLAGELRAIGEPVHLVGHDWGGHLAMRLATMQSEVPLLSWVSDVAYGWHPDYQWHDAATLWQNSPAGEQSLAGLRVASGSGVTFGSVLQDRGLTPALAEEIDAAHDETMSEAILGLYRSAWPNFNADWGRDVSGPTSAPGLILTPTADAMSGPALSQDAETAALVGAQQVKLEGLSHYWMLQDAAQGAEVLQTFWAGLSA